MSNCVKQLRPLRRRAGAAVLVSGFLVASGCSSDSGGDSRSGSGSASAGSQQSPLDALDPNQIPAEERRAGQPEELVAVLAPAQKYRTGHTFVAAVAFHPSGRWLVSTYR